MKVQMPHMHKTKATHAIPMTFLASKIMEILALAAEGQVEGLAEVMAVVVVVTVQVVVPELLAEVVEALAVVAMATQQRMQCRRSTRL